MISTGRGKASGAAAPAAALILSPGGGNDAQVLFGGVQSHVGRKAGIQGRWLALWDPVVDPPDLLVFVDPARVETHHQVAQSDQFDRIEVVADDRRRLRSVPEI